MPVASVELCGGNCDKQGKGGEKVVETVKNCTGTANI